jgi:hypothetical protein
MTAATGLIGKLLQDIGVAPVPEGTANDAVDPAWLVVCPWAHLDTAGTLVSVPALQNVNGGLANEDHAVARPVCVAGVGASLLGIGRRFRTMLDAMKPDHGLPPAMLDEFLAGAIVAYNEQVLAPDGFPDLSNWARALKGWRVGVQLTLPIEFDMATTRWQIDFTLLQALMSRLVKDFYDIYFLSNVAPAELSVPDPKDLRDSVVAQMAGVPSIDHLGARFVQRLLDNACDPVFEIVSTFQTLARSARAPGSTPAEAAKRGKATTDTWDLLKEMTGGLKPHHVMVLARISGGHAVLRALMQALLSPLPASSYAAVRDAGLELVAGKGLAQQKDAAGAWRPLAHWGPGVEPTELPIASDLVEVVKGKDELRRAMALGRAVVVSTKKMDQELVNKFGYTHSFPKGIVQPFDHLKEVFKDRTRTDPMLKQPFSVGRTWTPRGGGTAEERARRVIALEGGGVSAEQVLYRMKAAARICGAEGSMDSISNGDPGIISLGFQQWAAHTDEELTVIMERFRVQDPEFFDVCLGTWGLQTMRWRKATPPKVETVRKNGKDVEVIKNPGGKPAIKSPIENTLIPQPINNDLAREIDDDNPFGPDPDAMSDLERLSYFPSHATFVEVPAGEARRLLPPPGGAFKTNPYTLARRFFCGDPNPATHRPADKQRSDAWCARMRLAVLVSDDMWRVMLHQAAWRFTRAATNNFAFNKKDDENKVPIAGSPGSIDYIQRVYKIHRYGVLEDGWLKACSETPVLSPFQATLAELLPSEFSACTALDTHINTPSSFAGYLLEAAKTAGGRTHVASGASMKLDPVWQMSVTLRLMSLRKKVTDYAKRNTALLALVDHRGSNCLEPDEWGESISSDPSKFLGW